MGNIFNKDFRDFIEAFNYSDVEYILVGGYSVILYGYSRNTGDLDLWVRKPPENYERIKTAFLLFGMPLFDMSHFNFLENPDFDVFSFGCPPVSIDIMTNVKGLDFEEAFVTSKMIKIENISVRLIQYEDLIKAKKASGRSKDLDDLENLRPRK